MATLIISNEDIKVTLKIVKYLEESGLLNKDAGKLIENEVKEQTERLFRMLAATLGANLLANIVVGDAVDAKIPEGEVIKVGEGRIRVVRIFIAASSFN